MQPWIEPDPFPASPLQPRNDGWQNAFTGYGTARDKTSYGSFVASEQLDDLQLDALFYTDDIAAKIVEKKPEECFRRSYELIDTEDQEAAKALYDKGQALALDEKLQEGMTWGRLYGGALLVLGIKHGNPELPLNEEQGGDIAWINVIDRREVTVERYYENPNKENYGLPEVYRISGYDGNVALVHETRCIRFDGVPVDRRKRRELGGWSYSVLQRPYDVIRNFAAAFQAAGVLASEASVGVFKLKGLFEMVAARNKEALQTRMQLVDMSKSAARSLLIDADEEYDRIKTDFTGFPDMLDRFSQRLASSIDMPVTLLMGTSPAGMNATGASDFQHWYDTIRAYQAKQLGPKVARFYRILSKGKFRGLVQWRPLAEPSDKEVAETEKTRAETDGLYIDKGVVLPEQIALARFGKATNGRIVVDDEALLRALQEEANFSKSLEAARGTLGEKELAALSIAQGVSPIIVSSLINAAGKEGAGQAVVPGQGPPSEQKPAPKDNAATE